MRHQAIFITSLILCAALNTATATKQGILNARSFGNSLRNSHIGKAIQLMLEVHAGADYNYDNLFSALGYLQDSILEKKQTEETEFEEDSKKHNYDQQRFQANIQLFEAQEQNLKNELGDLQEQQEQLEKQLAEQNEQLSVAEQNYEQEKAVIDEIVAQFQATALDYNNAINLLAGAIEKMNESRSSISGHGWAGFVQEKSEEYSSYYKQLEYSLKRMKTSEFYISPVTSIFLQITMGSATADGIDDAIQVLQDLKGYTQKELSEITITFNNTKQKHDEVLEKFHQEIVKLKNDIIPNTEENLESTKVDIEQHVERIDETETLIVMENKNMNDEADAWDQRQQDHEDLMTDFDDEYLTTQKAIEIVKKAYVLEDA